MPGEFGVAPPVVGRVVVDTLAALGTPETVYVGNPVTR
jgi:hypothetical protein